MTESLHILLHKNISDPFRLILSLRPLSSLPPHLPGVFIHGRHLGNVSHLSWRGVNAVLVVFIAVTGSKDEEQSSRDISKKSRWEVFENHRRNDVACTWQLCVGASQAQYSSATLWPRVFARSALIISQWNNNNLKKMMQPYNDEESG